jgi:hypothetical protein
MSFYLSKGSVPFCKKFLCRYGECEDTVYGFVCHCYKVFFNNHPIIRIKLNVNWIQS